MSIPEHETEAGVRLRVDELGAEVARLQTAPEGAEGGAKMLRQELDFAAKREKEARGERNKWADTARTLKGQRDDYKAQSKLRGKALEHSIPRLCEGCYLKWPYTPKSFEPIGDGNIVREVGEGDGHAHPRGGVTACTAQVARAAIDITPERAGEKERR